MDHNDTDEDEEDDDIDNNEDYDEDTDEGDGEYNDNAMHDETNNEINNETDKTTNDEQDNEPDNEPNDNEPDDNEPNIIPDDEPNNNEGQRATNQTMEEQEDIEEQEIVFESDDEIEDAPLFEDYGELQEPVLRRSTRETRSPVDYKPTFEGQKYQHLHVQTEDNTVHYDSVRATVAAMAIHKLNLMQAKANKQGVSLVETYSLKKGLKKFGKRAEQSETKEMKQLHNRVCFRPINPTEMTADERKKAMESLIFLTEKKDGRLKARTVANGSVQRK